MAVRHSGYGGFLGLDWDYIARFKHRVDHAKVPIDDLQKTFIHWLGGPGRGTGALTKNLADHFTAFVRARILSQQAFQGMPALSPMWTEMKTYLGLDPRMGVAKGYLAEAIKPLDTGYGKYRVGISKNEVAPDAAGSIKNVAEYAILLEKGWTAITKHGKSRSQPPRPFFGESFLVWSYQNLPNEIATSIYRDMWPELKMLYNAMGKSAPRFEPEDLYTVDYAGEGASGAQEVFQESTQAGGTTFGQSPSEYTGRGAESSEMQPGEPGVGGEGSGRAEFIRSYAESERPASDEIMETKEGWMTVSGDIFDRGQEKWVDIESYYNKYYGGF